MTSPPILQRLSDGDVLTVAVFVLALQGKYTVLADVYQPDGDERKEIMCLQASVTFGRQR